MKAIRSGIRMRLVMLPYRLAYLTRADRLALRWANHQLACGNLVVTSEKQTVEMRNRRGQLCLNLSTWAPVLRWREDAAGPEQPRA